MKILILGGTAFLGPELVAAFRAKGAEITLFNRGKTNPGLFADLEQLRGDRDPSKAPGLSALEAEIKKGRTWDAVLDTSAYVPRIASASATLLKPAVSQYVLISTVSVYADQAKTATTEDDPVATTPDPTVETVSGETYGPLKSLCEREIVNMFGDRATILRPGLIVGPGDPTDRFTYWPVRLARGGRVLLPVAKDPWKSQVQFIDVRDLAEFTVKCVQDGHGGTINATGPDGPMSFEEMVFGIRAAVANRVEFVPVPEETVVAKGIGPWMELPLWVPQSADGAGLGTASIAKALSLGLAFRPLATTARDTIDWFAKAREGGLEFDFGKRPGRDGGLSREREAEVIGNWLARTAPH
jgi:2'-hydroxyisoflavone reductase